MAGFCGMVGREPKDKMPISPPHSTPRSPEKTSGEPVHPLARAAALARWVRRGLLVAALAGVLAFVAGFFWFVSQVPGEEITLDRRADGIVVLTGGAARIGDAIELLAAGRG